MSLSFLEEMTKRESAYSDDSPLASIFVESGSGNVPKSWKSHKSRSRADFDRCLDIRVPKILEKVINDSFEPIKGRKSKGTILFASLLSRVCCRERPLSFGILWQNGS